ncbi:MAG TPA: ABC transporter permease [Dehalococcoidia bacterium]|nr:ABC transporter permease [Dehalococcoidia bacterium]
MSVGQSTAGLAVLEREAGYTSTWGRRWHGVVRFFRTKPLGTIGAVLMLILIVCAIFAGQIAPSGYDHRVIADRTQAPSAKHWLGTDEQGRDELSRIIYGARVSVTVGFGAIAIATVISSTIGMVSGFFGGWLDTVIQRFIDMWIAFPALILLLAAQAAFKTPTGNAHWGPFVLQPSQQRTAEIILILGVLFSPGGSRVIRGAALSVRNNLYVEGARTIGASNVRILRSYILPNVLPTIIVLATLQLGAAILAEATLSFLGFGVPDPIPSWGRMLAGIAQARIRTDPWLSIWPGLAISLTVYGFNMFGDALRDVLDPRLRGS